MIGINLSPITYWGSQHPFNNWIRARGPWWTSTTDRGDFVLGENGEILFAGASMMARVAGQDHRPVGVWNFFYEGSAHIYFSGKGVKSSTAMGPGHVQFETLDDHSIVHIKVSKIDTADPPRNLRIFPPGVTEEGWSPAFLEFLKPFNPIRFMDWQMTNHSKVSEWSDRRPDGYVTQASEPNHPAGVSIGTMIDLCNVARKDMWFCMPHLATDDYVRRSGEQVNTDLSPELKVYIELSNEVWNWGFTQSRYADAQGQLIELGDNNPTSTINRFYAQRSVEVFAIWKEIFGDRLVRVLGSQSQQPRIGREIMEWNDAYKSADALAIAPYFGGELWTAAGLAEWTPEQVFEYLRDPANVQSIPEVKKTIAANKALADEHDLRLIAYEAGQHLVARGAAKKNDKLTAFLGAINNHPEMGRLYTEYLNDWQEISGDTICLFSSIRPNGKNGNWGLKLYQDQPTTPKLAAVLAFIGAPVSNIVTRLKAMAVELNDIIAEIKGAGE